MISNVSDVPTNALTNLNSFMLTQLSAGSDAYATDNGVLGLMLLNRPTGTPGEIETFDALVVNPIFGFQGTRTFYETGPDTNTFKTRRVLLTAVLDALESGEDTLEFRTDLLTSQGSTLTRGNAVAVLGSTYRVAVDVSSLTLPAVRLIAKFLGGLVLKRTGTLLTDGRYTIRPVPINFGTPQQNPFLF